MRLPTTTATAAAVSRVRLRVPQSMSMNMKLHQNHLTEYFEDDGKMGQVQDDQSRTTSGDEEDFYYPSVVPAAVTTADTFIVQAPSEKEIGVRHATDFNEKSTKLMNSTRIMEAVLNYNNKKNSDSPKKEDDSFRPLLRSEDEIMSGGSSSLGESREGDEDDVDFDDDDDECGHEMKITDKNFKSPSNFSSSQINSSAHLRKVKRRTLWWTGGGIGGNRSLFYLYATICLFSWMVACGSFGPVEAITTSGKETGIDLSSESGTSDSHKLSVRSAAIVKLEPDYQPIRFPKKDLDDNQLHSQPPQSFIDQLDPVERFDESGNRVKADAFVGGDEPNDTTRSTIIYRGIRNRTRVESGPVSLFATKKKSFTDDSEDASIGKRRGRVMFPKSDGEFNSTSSPAPGSSRTTKSEALLAATLNQSSEEGSSRKASPDVQDIIDGIVKLLGGKVHHPQSPAAAMPPVPFSQRQPQSTAYNLFNPTKPIYYQTVKPSRINSRGPPLGGNQQNNNNLQQSSQQQSSFEAIPLEVLNSEFKLNQSRFGPPFPLPSQVSLPPEAPYKQGVPVPEQLVPPQPSQSSSSNNGNFNLRQPSPSPSSSYVTTPTGTTNNNNVFFNNGNNRYNNGNTAPHHHQHQPPHWPSSVPPSPPASNHNGNQGLTTLSTSLTTPPNKNNHNQINVPQSQHPDSFNENGTRNPYQHHGSASSSNQFNNDNRKPTYSEGSGERGNTALATIPSLNGQGDKNHLGNNRALSSPRPPPLSLTLPTGLAEDDEEDDLRFTTNVDFDLGSKPGIKWNESPTPDILEKRPEGSSTPVSLEPTITEDSQLPVWTSSNTNYVKVGENSKETTYEIANPGINTPPSSANGFIRPTSANTLYPTLVLETNKENGLVEIVTKLAAPGPTPQGGAAAVDHPKQEVIQISATQTVNQNHQPSTETPYLTSSANNHEPHPESNLRKQVQHFNNLVSTTKQTSTTTGDNSQSIHALPTPPLRPGIVINDGPAGNDAKGYGSVEVVTVDEAGAGGDGKVGEIFDVTVTAKQSFGGQATGEAFSVKDLNKEDLVITQPSGTEQYVSIDGKRTYFNLHPNTPTAIGAGGATKAVGHVLPVENTDVISVEIKHPGSVKSTPPSSNPGKAQVQPNQNIGVGTVGNPVPLLPQPPGKTLFGINSGSSGGVPGRAVSTSLSISGSGGGLSMTGPSGGSGPKTMPNLIRRPLTRRPSIPPVRIDTCIVGDDTTCNSDQGEVCRTESGVSSCVCRSGYARRRHREPCRAIVSLVMSIKLDKLGDKKLTYNPDYFNPNSELYQTLEWETIHAMDSALGETTLSAGYVGSKLEAIGFDGRHAVVNTTVLIHENPKQAPAQVKRDLQKQMIQVLTRNRNNFGKSQLWVEGPISAVAAITDFDECESPDTNDCDLKARCVNTLGSFECRCEPGYGDPFEKDRRRSGRKCETCNGKAYCNGRGECLVENGQKVCKCAGNYYGSQCDIDGEVLAVAIGASVSAVVIIGLTLACLCMWSRKWKREEQKAALMSRTLFGGMATQALSYLGKNNSNPYQQHLSMDDRLRWAQATDPSLGGNIYVQNEPMSMHTSPQLIGTSMMETPPLMSARRSAETVDTTVDDLFDERQTKRPRSRASQLQGSLYYDLEPEPKSDIYASRSMVQFPAQFCVPMGPMSHYAAPPNRGYFP